jgi:hypothetical protein
MDQVYGNSICNLSATGFHNGQEGLLPTGDLREIVPPEMDFAHLWGKGSAVKYSIVSTFDWRRYISKSPLNRRAWVCQEHIIVRTHI